MSDFDKDLDNYSELLEKSAITEIELIEPIQKSEGEFEMKELFDTILALGPEGLKKALPLLSDDQAEMLKEALQEMKKAAEFKHQGDTKELAGQNATTKDGEEVNKEDENADAKKQVKLPEGMAKAAITPEKITDAPQAKTIMGKLDDTILQEELANDDVDEKLVDKKNKDVKPQGDDSVLEGQVIKAEEVEMPKKDFVEEHEKLVEVLKEGKPEEQKKEGEEQAKELKEEIKPESKDIAEKTELKKECNAPAPMKKSIVWTEENILLKACTGGRNYHVSVNDIYDAAIAEMNAPAKELEKSEKFDVNTFIEDKMDKSINEVNRISSIRDHKTDETVKLSKSFADVDMMNALGITEDELKKILGE